MKRLSILLLTFFLLPLLLANLSVQAAEVLPETGTISYTDYSGNIELTDINAGSDGRIYITEKFFGSALVLTPLSGDYKFYSRGISGDTGDVQPGPDGRIWYTDNADQLAVFDPSGCPTQWDSCPEKIWQFPGLGSWQDKINIGSIAFDDQGGVWVGDYAGTIQRLYRVSQIDDNNLEYCPFNIGNYHTHDLKFHDGAVWFGDYTNHRIQRFEQLDSTSGSLSYWQLPVEATPDGIVFDASGGLWWGEIERGYIGHLTFGTSDTLTYYQIPGTALLEAISIQSGKIWYSDHNGKVGRLDPTTAPFNSTTVVESSPSVISVDCNTLSSSPLPPTQYYGTYHINFNAFNPPLSQDATNPGWTIYTLPAGSKPAGMAAVGNQVYVADSDTSTANVGKLVRITIPDGQYKVFLPLILR